MIVSETVPEVKLNYGTTIPQIGFGTLNVRDRRTFS